MFGYLIEHILELSACINRSIPLAGSITATWSLLLAIDSRYRKSYLSYPSHTCVCVLGQPKLVGSVLTFPSGYDILEYSWVKATSVSMCLWILFVTLQNTNKLSGAVAGERQLLYIRTQFIFVSFLFLWFYLNPRYPWSSYPFYSSRHPRASSMSQRLPLTQFFPLAMNSAQAL